MRFTVKLKDNTPIRYKPYPLPHAKREEPCNEVDSMLEMGEMKHQRCLTRRPSTWLRRKMVLIGYVLTSGKNHRVDPEPMMTTEDLFRQPSGNRLEIRGGGVEGPLLKHC